MAAPAKTSVDSDPSPSYRKDPLAYFDHQLQTAGDVFWLPDSTLCVAEPTAAKAVLANPEGLFKEHSDFFHTRRGPFGPRELQVALGRGARQLLTGTIAARAHALPATIERLLGRGSDWPDAGTQLIFRHLHPALVTPERAQEVGPILDQIMHRGVLAGARERYSLLNRALFRRKAFRALTREIETRVKELNRRGAAAPRDLFDVLAGITGPGARASDLAQLYLPFIFAIAGSVGFTLGWALYLLGTNPPTDATPASITREALRLWPVAWQLARHPARRHEIAGVEVSARHVVLVAPYVTHRHPAHWREPNRFLPERWENRRDHAAFFPFGWGPHTCAAAALTLELVSAVLEVLLRQHRLTVAPAMRPSHAAGKPPDQPFTGPSLAPPRFRLALSPRARQHSKGGDSRGEAKASNQDGPVRSVAGLRQVVVPL